MVKTQEETFYKVLRLFYDNNLLEHIIIVGSWAEWIYYRSNFIENYLPVVRTFDLDILIPNINKPDWEFDTINEFQKKGFEIEIKNDGICSLFNENLEIQFLVQDLGRGKLTPYEVKPFKITAEGLRYFDITIDNKIKLKLGDYNVFVPHPSAYLLHKLIINSFRKPDKKIKDISSVKNLTEHILNDNKSIIKAKDIFETLSKKRKKLIKNTCEENNILLLEVLKFDHE